MWIFQTDSNGLHPTTEKTKLNINSKRPINVSEPLPFLVLVNYNNQFFANLTGNIIYYNNQDKGKVRNYVWRK